MDSIDDTKTKAKTNQPAALEKVGYKKPPIINRFKPGVSGNPKGRPKKAHKTLNSYIYEILERPVTVTLNGRLRKTNMAEAIATKFVQKAATGDHRALAFIMDRADAYWMHEKPYQDIKKIRSRLPTLSPKEREILEYLETKSKKTLKGESIQAPLEDLFRFNTDEEVREMMLKLRKQFYESL